MIEGINLERWLGERSESVEDNGSEIIFTGLNGRRSVLVRRSSGLKIDYDPKSSPLQPFYHEFVGASIFRGMLLIGSTVEGGVHLSLGFTIPHIYDIRKLALELNVNLDEQDEVFMNGSAGMFFFAYNPLASAPQLRCYDRDFGSVHEDRSFGTVLDELWQIIVDG